MPLCHVTALHEHLRTPRADRLRLRVISTTLAGARFSRKAQAADLT